MQCRQRLVTRDVCIFFQIDEAEADNCTEISAITTTHRFINQLVLKAAGHLGRDLALLMIKKGAKEILKEAREQNCANNDKVY